jgi:uncharacterized membrane protein required for colicin V production
MIDLVLGALLAVLAVRGWTRGLVKEVISLGVLVVGTVLSFRVSTPLGRVIAAMAGTSPGASRIVAGIVIFLAVAVGAAVVSKVMHLGMRLLPGVSTLNRAGGAALSLLALVLVVTILVSLAAVTPLPEAVAGELDDSSVAATLTDPEGFPQHVLGLLSGDRVVEMTLRIQELSGRSTAVALPGHPITVGATVASELVRLPDAEDALVGSLDRERVAAGQSSVLRSAGLDQIAFDLAAEGYAAGQAVLYDDTALRDRLNAAGLPSTDRTEMVVLAASPETGHAALVDERRDYMTRGGFSKVGVAALQGSTGILIVEVITG